MTADAVVGTEFIRHGGRKFSNYFVFNTDHKVIGIQYMVVSFAFFLFGGLARRADSWPLGFTHQPRSLDGATTDLHDPRHRHDLPVDHPSLYRARPTTSSR